MLLSFILLIIGFFLLFFLQEEKDAKPLDPSKEVFLISTYIYQNRIMSMFICIVAGRTKDIKGNNSVCERV